MCHLAVDGNVSSKQGILNTSEGTAKPKCQTALPDRTRGSVGFHAKNSGFIIILAHNFWGSERTKSDFNMRNINFGIFMCVIHFYVLNPWTISFQHLLQVICFRSKRFIFGFQQSSLGQQNFYFGLILFMYFYEFHQLFLDTVLHQRVSVAAVRNWWSRKFIGHT